MLSFNKISLYKNVILILLTVGFFQLFTVPASADVGVPSVDVDYDQEVTDWWATHPLNPDYSEGVSIGEITSPSTVITVEPDATCDDINDQSNIQDALDALPDVPTKGYTLQLQSGTYCGNFRINNDYEDDGSGGFTKTFSRDNIHLIGQSDGSSIISTSFANPTHTTDDQVLGEVLGCPESSNYTTLFGYVPGVPSDDRYEKVMHCIQNPIRNIYFKDLVFDGNNVSAFMLEIRTARDIVLDNVTFKNTTASNKENVQHHSPFWGMAILYNVWCRNCTFTNNAQPYSAYLDGVHGGGIIYSSFDGSATSGSILYLTNDDMTRDRDLDGTVEGPQEYGLTQYAVTYKNTFAGRNTTNLSTIATSSEDSLIKGNIVNGQADKFVKFDLKSNRVSQPAGINPTLQKFSYDNNYVLDNIVRTGRYIAHIDQDSDVCGDEVGENTATYAAGKCATVGDNIIRNNVLYQMLDTNTNYNLVYETWDSDDEGSERIIASTLEDNCANSGVVADGTTPASSGDPHPAISTTTACTTQPPATSTGTTNLLINPSFENLTTGYPTNWWNRPTASSYALDSFLGSLAFYIEGSANTYIFSSSMTQPATSTDYILAGRIKALNLATENSSYRSRLEYVENGAYKATTPYISYETDYWRYATARFTTNSSISSQQFRIAYNLNTNDDILVDDLAFFKATEIDQEISLPESNNTGLTFNSGPNNPTGSITIEGGKETIDSDYVILSLNGSDDIDADVAFYMWISNNSDFSTGAYETYGSSKSWQLADSNGEQTVFVKYKDVLGNESPVYSDTITVSSTSSNSSCSAIKPHKTPSLYAAIPTSENSIELFWTDADGSYTDYSIQYGTNSGEYPVYKEDFASKGTRNLTITNLEKETSYYFRIRAENNCIHGDWSNEIAAKTAGTATIGSGNLDLKITPLKTTEEKHESTLEEKNNENGAILGYSVTISVKDESGKPVHNASVTIHSKVQTGTTDKEGNITFRNVEPGQHRVIIAYGNFKGEQEFNLSGDVERIQIDVTVKSQSVIKSKTFLIVVGVLSMITIICILLLKPWKLLNKN